jgi:hypothetical protein
VFIVREVREIICKREEIEREGAMGREINGLEP